MHGKYAVISDYQNDTTDIGRAHVFDLTTGNLKYTPENPTPDNEDFFSFGATITEQYVIIGATHDDDGGSNSGAFYIFDVETGILLQTITGVASENIGRGISFHDGRLLVGAHTNDTGANNAGAVHIYKLADSDTVSYSEDTIGVEINISGNVAGGIGSEAEGDVISGFENITGGSGADTLVGNDLANTLTGNAGADFLTGGAGSDTIIGRAGDDIIQGHSISQGTIDLILDQTQLNLE